MEKNFLDYEGLVFYDGKIKSHITTEVTAAKNELDELKANKGEMSITPGTGNNSDKTTITLKNEVSADVLTSHLDISGKQDKIDALHKLNADYVESGQVNAAYTTIEQLKLTGIEAGAQVNVKSDWNAVTGDAEILNKPDVVVKNQTSGLLKNDGSVDTTSYQGELVSGTNIKTINNESILGSGNITTSSVIFRTWTTT